MRKITRQLLKKSNESFLLALELFNKPTIAYRTESFAILFTNAWELLMKAYIYEKSQGRKLSIFRRKRPKQRRESMSFDECLVKTFQNESDPVKKNLEYVSEIRNTASHLIIKDLDPYFSRAYQAGVFNYLGHLNAWFNKTLEDEIQPGLLALTLESQVPSSSDLRKSYNKEDFETVVEFIKRFNELEKLGVQAAISMKYTVAIVRNPKKADFVISAGAGKRALAVIEKIRDVDTTHPFNRTAAMKEIRKRISKKIKFNEYSFEAYVFVEGVKKSNNEYFWRTKYSGAGQYSQKFIDELISAMLSNPKNISRWRSQYVQHLRRKKRRR